MAVESVDAHLREAAVLAVVFHTQSRHEIERLCQTDGIGGGHGARRDNVDQRRRLPAECLLAVRGNRDFIHVQGVVVVVRQILSPRTKGYRPEQERQGIINMSFHFFAC